MLHLCDVATATLLHAVASLAVMLQKPPLLLFCAHAAPRSMTHPLSASSLAIKHLVCCVHEMCTECRLRSLPAPPVGLSNSSSFCTSSKLHSAVTPLLCCCLLLPAAPLHHGIHTTLLLHFHACLPAANILFAACCLLPAHHSVPCCPYCRVRLPCALSAALILSFVSHACAARCSPALHGMLISSNVPCADSHHSVSR